MTTLDPPKKRECHRCGREEAWDDAKVNWTIAADESIGDTFCIHEWNITGAYSPVRD
ncbi:HEWD family protein [Halorussus amylolyticus]|uniref:HEWD family protein n=1 Tax=Halorussus amylolyticus TaxID=1126242 RepID=UPI00192F9C8A|nr:HEWD family protein [Halorussus amylolyticus]